MGTVRKFGLIGKNIGYSFSKKYFEEKFRKLFLKNHSYDLLHLASIDEIEKIFSEGNFTGLNVTIPYKTEIIPYLDELSKEAKIIGAVNCIHMQDGIKTGYNTDVFGFEKTLLLHKKPQHQNALILGDGGAAKAVRYVLNEMKIPHQTVSRKGILNFENLAQEMVSENLIIIQTTPVGTFPNFEESLNFPFEALTENHLVIDLIYNPDLTLFLKKAAEQKSKTVNGYFMLEHQAEKAWQIWNLERK